jgi:hypothetical protein
MWPLTVRTTGDKSHVMWFRSEGERSLFVADMVGTGERITTADGREPPHAE